MASTGTVAVAVGSTTAAITFAVVTIVGSTPPRSDLGEPVFVETDVTTGPGSSVPLQRGENGGRP